MRRLLRRRIGWVVTIAAGTARAITILRGIISSRVRYVRRRPVRRGVNRTWIGNGGRRHIRVSLVSIAIVWPVHPWVIAVNFYNITLLLLWLWVSRCLCQPRGVIVVYGSANVLIAVGNAGVRVSTLISHSVNYSSRARPVVTISCRAHNGWPVNIDLIVTDHRFTVVTIIDVVYMYRFARIPSDFIWLWTAYIGNPVINVSVIDNGSLVDDSNYTRAWNVIPGYVRAANISLRCTYPIIIRYVIAAAK